MHRASEWLGCPAATPVTSNTRSSMDRRRRYRGEREGEDRCVERERGTSDARLFFFLEVENTPRDDDVDDDEAASADDRVEGRRGVRAFCAEAGTLRCFVPRALKVPLVVPVMLISLS